MSGFRLLNVALSATALIFVMNVAPLAFGSLNVCALAESQSGAETLPVVKEISLKALEKYPLVTVKVEEKGQSVTYKGVALRTILAEMLPDTKLDSMPEWKALNRRELVMEIIGSDGYPGIVTGTDIATNSDGSKYILATQKDGKPIESGVHLICKNDEVHVRWIHEAVKVRLLSIAAR